MRQEEETRSETGRAKLALVVECSHDGLAGASRRDHQIPTPIVQRALGLEVLEDLLLERVGPQREEDFRARVGGILSALVFDRSTQPPPVRLTVRVVGLEL